jgi:hypothetical protein
MPQTVLFTPSDLSDWLRQPVEDGAATVVEGVVWGWLRPLLKLDQRPEDPSPELVAWAIELGAIAYVNPEGLEEYQLEAERSKYSSDRRDEILRAAAGGGTTAPGAALAPVGSFPKARPYPDPAERC